jgi:hypothetical protein
MDTTLIHPLMGSLMLAYFHFLASASAAAVDICVHVFAWAHIFIWLRYTQRTRIAVLWTATEHRVLWWLYVQLFKGLPVDFQNNCTILHSHQQCLRAPTFPSTGEASCCFPVLTCNNKHRRVVTQRCGDFYPISKQLILQQTPDGCPLCNSALTLPT